MCVCVCVCACVRACACVHVRVRACARERGVCERVKPLKTLTENKIEILKLQQPKYLGGNLVDKCRTLTINFSMAVFLATGYDR